MSSQSFDDIVKNGRTEWENGEYSLGPYIREEIDEQKHREARDRSDDRTADEREDARDERNEPDSLDER